MPTPREAWLVLGATARVLRDSNRITDIHLVADITSRERFAALLRKQRAGGKEPEILAARPEIDDTTVDFAALRQLPETTLGGAYVRHLDRNALSIYTGATSRKFVHDADVRYLIHRYRQTHDIWHVLVGVGTKGHEEVLLHAFTLGLMGLPVSAMIVALGTVKHIVLERRWRALRHGLREAFANGRAAAPLVTVRWESLWDRPLESVREQFAIRPCSPAFVSG